jgi:hypothetical protein
MQKIAEQKTGSNSRADTGFTIILLLLYVQNFKSTQCAGPRQVRLVPNA